MQQAAAGAARLPRDVCCWQTANSAAAFERVAVVQGLVSSFIIIIIKILAGDPLESLAIEGVTGDDDG